MSIWELGLIEWFNIKVVHPLIQIINRGTEPKQLAFSTALGFTLGVFPVCGVLGKGRLLNYLHLSSTFIVAKRPLQDYDADDTQLGQSRSPFCEDGDTYHVHEPAADSGVTVFLCGMAIALFGGHCHTPSIMLANFLATPIELSLVIPFLRLGEAISGGPHFPLTSDALKKVLTGHASREVLLSVVHALLGWIVAAPFILGVLYTILLPLFKYLVLRYRSHPSSPTTPLFSPRAEIKVKVRVV